MAQASTRVGTAAAVLPVSTSELQPQAVPLLERVRKQLQARVSTLNVGVSWASNFILVAGSFIVTPAILGALGEENYGIWLLVMSFIGQMRILDLGMTAGCMKFSAAYYESGNRERLIKVFDSSVAIFGASGFLALLLTAALMFILPALYPAALGGMQGIIAALGVGMALDLFCRPYAASLRGRSLFYVYDGIEIVTYLIFKLGLVLYFAHAGLNLWLLCVLTLMESVIRNGIVTVAAMRLCSWITLPRPWRAERDVVCSLIGYSGAVFLMALADVLRFQKDAAVIGWFMPEAPDQISIYGIGFRLVMLASTTIGVAWSVLIPKFSGLSEKHDTDALWALFRKANLNNAILTVFGLVNIGVFGLPFLKLWLGKGWVYESYVLQVIVLPAYFAAMLAGPACGLLAGIGKLNWLTALTMVEALVNVALSVALARDYGIYGVCLGTALPMLVFRGVLLPIVLRRELHLSCRQYYRLHALAVWLAGVYLVLIAGFAFIDYGNFLELFAACVASTLVYAGLLYWIVPELRPALARLLPRLKSRAA